MNNKTMNTVRMAIGAVVVLGLAIACSMDEQPADTDTGLKAVRFTGDGIALVQSKTVSTARTVGNTWETTDIIGIYMIGRDAGLTTTNIKDTGTNKPYQAQTSAGTSTFVQTGGTIYYPASGYVEFIAYYPHGTPSGDFKVGIDMVKDQSSQSTTDVLYAPKTSGNYTTDTTSPVSLQFRHSLVSLKFDITAVTAEGVTEALTGMTVEITNQNTKANLDLTDGTIVNGNIPDVFTAKTTVNNPTTTATAEVIVPPTTSFASMNFVFTTSEGAYVVAVPTNPAQWESGKEYTYTVHLKRNEVGITGSVTPWGTGGTHAVDGTPQQ